MTWLFRYAGWRTLSGEGLEQNENLYFLSRDTSPILHGLGSVWSGFTLGLGVLLCQLSCSVLLVRVCACTHARHCMFECICVTMSARVVQALGWIASLPQLLSTYSLRCDFTSEPKAHSIASLIRLAVVGVEVGCLFAVFPILELQTGFHAHLTPTRVLRIRHLAPVQSSCLVRQVFSSWAVFPASWFGLVFLNTFLLCSFHWCPETHSVDLAGFGLVLILLPLPYRFWDGWHLWATTSS